MPDKTWMSLGKVTSLLPSGLGYVRLEGECGKTHPFVVGKTMRGYNGRPYKEFGLTPDATIVTILSGAKVSGIIPLDKRAPEAAIAAVGETIGKLSRDLDKGKLPNGETVRRAIDSFVQTFLFAGDEVVLPAKVEKVRA